MFKVCNCRKIENVVVGKYVTAATFELLLFAMPKVCNCRYFQHAKYTKCVTVVIFDMPADGGIFEAQLAWVRRIGGMRHCLIFADCCKEMLHFLISMYI